MQDYTLAQYKPETFEHLAYSQTVHQLTTNFGYPAELREFEVQHCHPTPVVSIFFSRDSALPSQLQLRQHLYPSLQRF